jgi:hypothetical protein
MPAKAGIQREAPFRLWISAYAGMTVGPGEALSNLLSLM